MRHGKKINHLGRTYTHRKALLSNMAISLILNKRIETTVAKARELRKFVEPILTRSKPHNDNTHNRRMVFSYLQNKEAVKELFGVVGEKISERPGGYTRIIKLGARLGDNAEMCIIELVDFNEVYGIKTDAGKAKTRRSRRGGAKATASDAVAPIAAETAEVAEEQAPVAEVATATEATEIAQAPEATSSDDAPAAENNEEENKA